MSAIVAVDILAGAFQLSSAQERVLMMSEGYVRGGSRVTRATRKVLVRLGLIEQRANGHYTTAWGDAVGEELVAREAAKGEYLPKIYWKSGRGWMDSDRFMVSIDGPQAYELADDRTGHVQVFKTLVHLRQHVREILAEDEREELDAAQDRWAERFGGDVAQDDDPAAYGEDLGDLANLAAELEAEQVAYDRETQRRRAVSLARRTEDVYTRPVSRRVAMDAVTGRQGVRVQVEGYQVFAWATRVDDRGVEILIRDLLVDEQVALTVLDPYDVNDELHARTALRRFLIDNVA